jgi:ATP-binding cassette subfamily B protein
MVLTGLSQLFVLGYGGLQVLSGSLSLGGITQFFIYLGLLIWPVAAIGWITNIVQRAAASMARLSKVLDDPNGESQTGLGEIPNSENGVGIEFRNVMMSYDGDARSALNDISIEIPAGTSLGITGSIGSGKTAFVNLIPRLFEIFSGQVLVNGVELSKLNPKAIRSVIGFVPQEPFLFSMSIADNVRFSKPDATNEEIEAACKLVELHSDVEQFPDRYNTILGERGITLSGGQKQRLAIARAILKNPAVLILDDALSAVDTQTEEQLLQNLRRFMTGRTSIIISHRISTIMHSDRIMTLLDGRIAEYGTHLELLANNGIYANLYNRQQLEREIETFNGEISN